MHVIINLDLALFWDYINNFFLPFSFINYSLAVIVNKYSVFNLKFLNKKYLSMNFSE